MQAKLVDTHCHLHLDAEAALRLNQGASSVDELGGCTVQTVPMAIRQDDWAMAELLGTQLGDQSDTYFCFGLGLHPWHVHQAKGDWLAALRDALAKHPRALLGEAGLDKAARCPDTGRVKVDWPGQREAFTAQFRLAAGLNRPMSIHCVRAHGTLLDMLEHVAEERDGGSAAAAAASAIGSCDTRPDELGLPPRLALHSYSGAVEVTKQLCALPRGVGQRVFFGFSANVNLKTEVMADRMRAALEHIPEERLLLESDSSDSDGVVSGMVGVCRAIAAAKGLTVGQVAALTARNAAAFLARVH